MLDALNNDCLRHVLSYLPVADILRAERVSRSWQHAVLQYLRGFRIRIDHRLYHYEETRGPRCRILTLNGYDMPDANCFEGITKKLGCSIVASLCYDECTLMIVTRNCPNLEHLALVEQSLQHPFPSRLSSTDQVINTKKLKQISFRYFLDVTDEFIGNYLQSNILEELIIFTNQGVTGHCLAGLQSTHLKSLCLISCMSLELRHLLSTLEGLTGLTKLELSHNTAEIFQNADLILKKVPKLEKLALNHNEEIALKGNIPESISRLDCLKRLDLSVSPNVSDEWLAVLASGCGQLRELNVGSCSVSARSVTEFCRAARSTLKALNVDYIDTMDDEAVAACINSCPHLELLDVSHCPVTEDLPVLLSARAHPLLISCNRTELRKIKDSEKFHRWLILDFDPDDNTERLSGSDEDSSDGRHWQSD